MIKLVLFDLDGVLADSREHHYHSLNKALAEIGQKYMISREDHLARFDALTTTKKLQMLTQERGLPKELHNQIWETKQKYTRILVEEHMLPNPETIRLFEKLKEMKLMLGVCSNATRDVVRLILHKLDLLHRLDFVLTNLDVVQNKPHGEIYMRAMLMAGVNATETLIVEDSHIGRTAALNSGAHLCAVADPNDVTVKNILEHIEQIDSKSKVKPKWKGGKVNILIPMAGRGSRFSAVGYTFPKPLIEVEGKPMIQAVTENLNIEGHHIYIVQKEHYEKYNLKQLLNLIAPGCSIIQVDGVTEGAACTTLLAKDLINNDTPLVIANSDQILDWDSNEFMYSMKSPAVHGGIVTFKASHPKWSFVKLNEAGWVTEVAEKNPISDNATAGVYYWSTGENYVWCAEQMIAKNIRTNNEFYVCPVYNEAIEEGDSIKNFPISKVWGVGTPEDLQIYLNRYR